MDLRVVLVGPENPLNVGFVARAMRCLGVEDLALVTDWKELPREARVTGVAAPAILDAVRLLPTLDAALADCATAVAFSRRPLGIGQRAFDLPAPPPELGEARGRVALVFGRESNGLTREEAALCPWRCRIPVAPGLSLNLGQAVSIALYQLRCRAAEPAPAAAEPVVALGHQLRLQAFLDERLSRSHRFGPPRLERLRQLLYRLRMTEAEHNLLESVMRELDDPVAERRARKRANEE